MLTFFLPHSLPPSLPLFPPSLPPSLFPSLTPSSPSLPSSLPPSLPPSLLQTILKGPSSPYEVVFYCMTNVGSIRPSRVERDSVNSIVVDPEPHNVHEKMMVAANVALNPSGSATLARATTLLPSIPGLPHLLCLLFAPTAELRRVWGLLCVGLG